MTENHDTRIIVSDETERQLPDGFELTALGQGDFRIGRRSRRGIHGLAQING